MTRTYNYNLVIEDDGFVFDDEDNLIANANFTLRNGKYFAVVMLYRFNAHLVLSDTSLTNLKKLVLRSVFFSM
jgi:hypothetical protein